MTMHNLFSIFLVCLTFFTTRTAAQLYCVDTIKDYASIDISGFTAKFSPAAFANLDNTPSSSNPHYPSATTYREMIAASLAEARVMMTNQTIDDGPWNKILYKIPFVFEELGNFEFFYGGKGCNDASIESMEQRLGCVATESMTQLVPELSGSWVMHEYGHAFMGNLGNCAQKNAISSAYDNAVANEATIKASATIDAGQSSSASYWYAFTNIDEYYACYSEAYFSVNGDITDAGHWPRNQIVLEQDDPQGFAALNGTWRLSPGDLDDCMSQCIPYKDDSSAFWTLAIILAVVLGVVGAAAGSVLYYYYYHVSDEKGPPVSDEASGVKYTKQVELVELADKNDEMTSIEREESYTDTV